MDCTLPDSPIYGIFQVRILEWVAIPFSSWVPNPGIKLGPPALQADSLPTELSGNPSTWVQSQKQQNDLGSLPRQIIQHHSNLRLCPNHQCWRSWSWMVLWRPKRPSRTNTENRCPFHHRGLECKSQKSRDTWSNRQIWPRSTEWSRAKANKILPRECTGHSKHPLPTTQVKTLHMDIARW